MPEPAKIKGTVLLSRLQLLRDRLGAGGLADFLKQLPPELRPLLSDAILPVSWYPLELGTRLDELIAQKLSPGKPYLFFIELGRNSAEVNLKGPHQGYLHSSDPHQLLRRSPQIYRLYYSSGYRTYERIDARTGVLRTFDAQDINANDCLTVIGWYQRAIELCGGQNARLTEPRCRCSGEALCEYLCRWD